MKKLKTFKELNELSGNVYRSVMDTVARKGDPRSFRLYADAKKLRSKYYTKEPLNIQSDGKSIKFEIMDIKFDNWSELKIYSKNDLSRDIILMFDVQGNSLRYDDGQNTKDASIDRKGAIILTKILKDYGVGVRPQDIPQS